MDFTKQAKLIWGEKWDWLKKPPEASSFRDAFTKAHSHFYYDTTLYYAFLDFFSQLITNWGTFTLGFMESELPEGVQEYSYAFREDGTILVKTDKSEQWGVFIKKMANTDKTFFLEYDESCIEKAVTLQEAWLEIVERGFYSCEATGIDRSLTKFIEPDWGVGTIPSYNDISTLYFFDSCRFKETIERYATEPPMNREGLSKLVILSGFWELPEDKRNPLPPLIVDPRIAIELESEFLAAKQKANSAAGNEIVFSMGEYVERILAGQYGNVDIPLILDEGQKNNAENFERDFMFRTWGFIREQILEQWKKDVIPPPPKLPKLYEYARKEISKASELIRIHSDFRNAIVSAGRACEWICLYEFGNQGTWYEVLSANRDKIKKDYGDTNTYDDLHYVREKRNKVEHDWSFEPDVFLANEIIDKASNILNNFQKKHLQPVSRQASRS